MSRATVDSRLVDAAERDAILTRYREHSARFESVAARRETVVAAVIPLQPLKELEQEPTAREIEVLQLISDGLVNREIGVRLFLSEETVKSQSTGRRSSSPELGSLPLRNFLSFLQFTLCMEQSLEGVGHARISHELADSARSNLRLLTCLEVIRCGKDVDSFQARI